MATANVNDPGSLEAVYSRADFERDARLNAEDKTAVQHGVSILSAPDDAGTFSIVRADHHVGEVEESSHSIFLSPVLEPSEYGALTQDDTDYGGPVEEHSPPEESADPYQSFLEDVIRAARSAHFPDADVAERLKGFYGG
ncbi:MAG TPA: hypothetical protein VD978_04290 [Azospirillum sp.]|nr:hypothetical protein [Azospirillum sp.]